MEKTENYVYAAILALLGGAAVYGANQIPSRASLGLGADFLPKIVGGLLLFFSAAFLVKGLLIKRPIREDGQEGQKKSIDFVPIGKFVLTVVFLAVYIVLLKRIGFFIMSTLYILAQSMLMVPKEKRNIPRTVVLALVTSSLLYLIFSKGLNMMLPPGILKGIF